MSTAAQLSAALGAELDTFCSAIEGVLRAPAAESGEITVQMACIQEAIEQLRCMSDVLDPRDYDCAVRRLIALRERLELLERQLATPVPRQAWIKGERGAWTLNLDEELLLELSELRFTDEEIGVMLNCSRRTVQRRRAHLGLVKRGQDTWTHEQLCDLIRQVRSSGSGQEGERAMTGALRSLDINVSRARLRLAVRDTDPFRHLLLRWNPIQRRVYSVPFVNSLWHLDGHHKLIRWRMVIHAAIDGKSRLVTFIQASSNNLASTLNLALQHFQSMWNNHPLRTPGLNNKSPRQLFVKGVLEAKRAGWSIVGGEAEAVGAAALLRDFSEFGAGLSEGELEREPRGDDPHIHIAALTDEIPPILLDPTVQMELRRRLDSIWPPPEDAGILVDAFRRALIMVQLVLRSPLNIARQ
ncbi:hypothetical protein OC834_006404 [Tilletia horrida]|nr:hypothetical protein OC834_006404 [Tilletia horrida]